MSAPDLPAGYVNVPPDELTRRLKGRRFALDTETNGLHWFPVSREAHQHPTATGGACASYFEEHEPGAYWADRVLGASLACPPAGMTTYIPFEANLPDGSQVSPGEQARFTNQLWDIVSSPETTIVGHNLKFDLHMLGMDPTEERFKATLEDTSVMAHLIDSRGIKNGGVARTLEALEQHYLGTRRKATHLENAPKHSAKGSVRTFPTWTLEAQQAYAGDDAVITYELAERLRAELARWKLEGVFRKEMKYLRVLWAIERRGVAIDAQAVTQAREALRERQAELEEKLYAAAGKRFLWTSPVQLSAVLYDDLGIPRPEPPERRLSPIEAKRYTSTLTGSPLLMEQVKHPVAGLVLGVRESAKLGTTLESWLHLSAPAQPGDERTLHTSLNQTGTRTSRLSSSSPNLQNTASDKRRSYVAEGAGLDGVYEGEATARNGAYRLRDPLVARPGYVFVKIDYAQQEVRMLGVLSREKRLLAKLGSRTDLHLETAELVWGIRDALHRSWAKSVNFATIYGLGLDGLAQLVGATQDEAQRILDTFWKALPGLRPWMEEVQRECIQQGYVRLWSGRIWRETDHRAAYKAINAVVQGGCAELTSVAILRCHQWLREHDAGHIVLPVHDELLFEVPAGTEHETAPALASIMEVPDLFGVPFVTDVKVGNSYGEMRDFGGVH